MEIKKKRKGRKKRLDQSLIFDKDIFRTKRYIKKWLKIHGYKFHKKKHVVLPYENTWRVRLRQPARFNKTTFKTKKLRRGVKIVNGYLK